MDHSKIVMSDLSAARTQWLAKAIEKQIKQIYKDRPSVSVERDAAFKLLLNEIIENTAKVSAEQTISVFSDERIKPVFVSDDTVILRPVSLVDADFYLHVKMQYSPMYQAVFRAKSSEREALFRFDICRPESFFCIIKSVKTGSPVGYLGIMNTLHEPWEIAIELDSRFTNQGFGSRSIRLFLSEISRVTGKTTFRAAVEADNVPSQKCFEKLGAQIVALENMLPQIPDEADRFEREHLSFIDDNMLAVAAKLRVDPQILLTHALIYQIDCTS